MYRCSTAVGNELKVSRHSTSYVVMVAFFQVPGGGLPL
jgi:hypothetical protein